MGFFSSEARKLPLRGRKKLPLRGRHSRRLKYLRQFEAGRLYTFHDYNETNLPDDLPYALLTEDYVNEQHRPC